MSVNAGMLVVLFIFTVSFALAISRVVIVVLISTWFIAWFILPVFFVPWGFLIITTIAFLTFVIGAFGNDDVLIDRDDLMDGLVHVDKLGGIFYHDGRHGSGGVMFVFVVIITFVYDKVRN